MSLFTRIFFSEEHVGSSGKNEVDVHRQDSDSSKHEKINHCNVDPGYGKAPVDIKINVEK